MMKTLCGGGGGLTKAGCEELNAIPVLSLWETYKKPFSILPNIPVPQKLLSLSTHTALARTIAKGSYLIPSINITSKHAC